LSSTLGVRNEANTAFVRMQDRLLITFDAGRPHEIDPTTLEVVTPVGAFSEWKRSVPELFLPGPLPLNMSGAHPFFDENTGELFSVNFGMAILGTAAFTDIVRWDGKGVLERWSVVLAGGAPAEIKQSMHQIGVTQDYLILMDCAFAMSTLQLIIPTAPSVAPMADSVVYIVKRSDLKAGGATVTAKKLVIPREGAHFTCDYENPSGRITLHFGHNDGADPAEWLRSDDVRSDNGATVRSDLLGMLVTTTDVNALGRYTIDGEAGTLLDTTLVYDMDSTWLPAIYTHRGSMTPGRFEDIYWVTLGYTAELLTKRVYDLYVNYPYRKVPLASLPPLPKQGTLFRLDAVTMKIADAYQVPAGRILLSPQFVPRDGKTGTREGYLVCSMISDDLSWQGSSGDEFWIFDAANLAQGPLCRLTHPDLDLGFTLHTTWMDAIAKRTATYRIPVRDDFAAGLATQTQEIKTLFENEVFPHFP
jgi:carotenoid cleavage dioxygenase-like enzyme